MIVLSLIVRQSELKKKRFLGNIRLYKKLSHAMLFYLNDALSKYVCLSIFAWKRHHVYFIYMIFFITYCNKNVDIKFSANDAFLE